MFSAAARCSPIMSTHEVASPSHISPQLSLFGSNSSENLDEGVEERRVRASACLRRPRPYFLATRFAGRVRKWHWTVRFPVSN